MLTTTKRLLRLPKLYFPRRQRWLYYLGLMSMLPRTLAWTSISGAGSGGVHMEVAGTVRRIMTTVGAIIQANLVFIETCQRIGGIVTTIINGKVILGTTNACTTIK